MNKHFGSSLDSLFEELGELEEVELLTQKKILASRIQRAMEDQKLSKVKLAQKMKTSRTEVYHLLDPHNTGVTLASMVKVSRALGFNLDILLSKKAA